MGNGGPKLDPLSKLNSDRASIGIASKEEDCWSRFWCCCCPGKTGPRLLIRVGFGVCGGGSFGGKKGFVGLKRLYGLGEVRGLPPGGEF